MLTLVASGEPSDYADTTELRSSIAEAAEVPADYVTIEVTAASVRITATIRVPPSSSADEVKASLDETLGSADDATVALGITVEADPTAAIQTPADEDLGRGCLDTVVPFLSDCGAQIGFVCGVVAAAMLVLLGIVFIAVCERKRGSGNIKAMMSEVPVTKSSKSSKSDPPTLQGNVGI